MKTKQAAFILAIVFWCSIFLTLPSHAATNYIVHEWGTFTSVQGGNGELLPWRPLQSSELPNFIYSWKKAGMNRGALFGVKGDLITLQRMETPVIYFYANQLMNVDVDVAFPKGFVTEWYPQATQIGPSFALNTNISTDGILHESRAVWRNLEIVPRPEPESSLQYPSPSDTVGSHYFAARETAADIVRANFATPTNNVREAEKFIFYRGAGSFKTPLHVTVDSNDVVSVENTGTQPLMHLFLLSIHDGRGAFGVIDELAASNSVTWLQLRTGSTEHWDEYPSSQFQAEIAAQMQTALAAEGLFPDEAQAMVNTWKDSWFTEDGVRVLYVLPRAWTDETLPMTLTPRPQELTRVMVGRAEIIAPDVETNLFQLLTEAQGGDAVARAETLNEFKKLGRFAEPALRLASTHAGGNDIMNFGYQLLYPTRSAFE